MSIWAQEIKELERYYESFKGHHPDLEKELERLITTEDENMVLLYSRRCLEVIITDLCETELKRPRKTEPLKGIIDKLNKEEKVPSHIITSMDHLNGLSTYGAHPKEFDPQQVRTVLINLTTILSWYVKYLSISPGSNSKPIEEAKKITLKRKKNTKVTWKVIPWSITGLLLTAIFTFWLFFHGSSQKTLPVQRLTCNLPKGEDLFSSEGNPVLALSPDGTKLVFVTIRNDTTNLYLRNIDDFEAILIPGTQGADGPFFSPDSKWIGFFADGNLKKISVQGGAPITLCEAENGFQASWDQGNNIIYEDDYKGLMVVSSSGGIPMQLTSSLKFINGRLDQLHLWPYMMPGEKNLLFTSFNNSDDNHVMAYSLETGKITDLFGSGDRAQYIQTGHLVYAWKGDLLAVPFNLKKMKVTGQPVIILKEGIMYNKFSISGSGSLVYVPGKVSEYKQRLVLVDQKGNSESLNFPLGYYISPRYSPDGKKILIMDNKEKANIWIYSLERGTINRFSDKESNAYWGIWSPDGKQIVFNSGRDGGAITNLFRKKSDGTGPVELLKTSNYHKLPKCWSADGRYLIYIEGPKPKAGIDIMLLPMEGDTTARPFLNSSFNEYDPALSPDGKWLAYVSDESGRGEVMVCSFPGKENITPISTAGGTQPVWAPDGTAIYYRNSSGTKLMVVSFIADPEPHTGKPNIQFQRKIDNAGVFGRMYDISPDGKHFFMIKSEEGNPASTQINVILNWFEEIKKLVPND
jgi:eukaryotic-like serine/threonine-protein kinase